MGTSTIFGLVKDPDNAPEPKVKGGRNFGGPGGDR